MPCEMLKVFAAPIFYKYSEFCNNANLFHDYFRDAALYSPMAHIASQLMGDNAIRQYGFSILGADNSTTIPARWHTDYTVFPTGGEIGCHNGLVMWIPIEESFPNANGLKVIGKT